MNRIFLFIIVLAFAASVGCGGGSETAQDDAKSSTPSQAAGTIKKAQENVAALSNPKAGFDPVCGMALEADATIVYEHEGKEYGFCGDDCVDEFKANPAKYIVAAHDHDGGDQDHDH